VGNSDPSIPTLAQQNSPDETYPSTLGSDYTQLPQTLDPRIRALASTETRNAKSVYQRSSMLESFLKTKFTYSLDMDTPPGRDPLTYVLFERKIGHCEYFAYSMAVMLRTLGIPSRIVNGFHGGEFNDVTGSYIVRARDAHAWVEAYIPGFGWATFDPTPASDDATLHTGWSRIALYADAVREFWREWVVNYDFSHQENLARSSASSARQNFDHFRIWAKDKYEQLLAAARLTKESAAGAPRAFALRAGLLLLLFFAAFNLKRWIAYYHASRLASSPSRAPRAAATIWYQRLLRFLARRGFDRAPGQTPQEFMAEIEEPTIREKVADFVLHYERARFGSNPEAADRLPSLYTQIESAIKH